MRWILYGFKRQRPLYFWPNQSPSMVVSSFFIMNIMNLKLWTDGITCTVHFTAPLFFLSRYKSRRLPAFCMWRDSEWERLLQTRTSTVVATLFMRNRLIYDLKAASLNANLQTLSKIPLYVTDKLFLLCRRASYVDCVLQRDLIR